MTTTRTKAAWRISKPMDTWSVRGVSQETRAAVKVAARNAGKPVGEWLEETLRRAATEQTDGLAEPDVRIEDALAKIVERLEAIVK